MSVVSKNPFDLLGDDGEERASSPAPKAKPAAAAAPAKDQPKVVPGAASKGGRGARYPSRGGPRNVYREERPAGDAAPEGFDGERVAPPKRAHQGRDKNTKGPREDRPPRTRGGAAAGSRGPKGQGRGGPRPAEAAAGDKKAENFNNDEGKAELNAEKQGEKDGAEAAAQPEEAAEAEEEEEDNSKTLDQYLAEKAQAALGGVLAKKEVRQVSDDKAEGKVFEREEADSFFTGKPKETKAKDAKAKKEKVFIEIDGQFRADKPAREPRGDARAPRGGRGGARGGARGGNSNNNNASRGPRAPRQAPINTSDETAFPSLG